ncbi:MAG: iron-containing alcohol dehydrogenase [Treponema sp.]|jgi:alcohol dehydrogenase class IV|nr:iron-containing alcohol dehydrogenase [Treponema sp.]
MGMRFAFNLPVNLLFGSGVIEQIGEKAAAFGGRALVVTGRGSAKKSGLLDKVQRLLRAAGVQSVVFDQVEPNPTTTMVYEGLRVLREGNCGFVVGLGGGSILDAAKAIAFAAKNEGDLMDYIYARKTPGDALPIVLVPTTCGTGSEGNSFAVITDPVSGDKKSLRCNAVIAKLSLVDPQLMTTMPRGTLASVGFDALCHCMEAWLSGFGQPVSNLLALEGMRLAAASLRPLYRGSGGPAEWEQLTWASTLGGMCIGIAGITAPHGIEHPASGLRNIVHGRGLAALTPVIYERSIAAAPEKFAEISRRLGGKNETDCVNVINNLLVDIDLAVRLRDEGIKAEDIDWMAENALKVSAAGLANHPAPFGVEEIKAIYRAAW